MPILSKKKPFKIFPQFCKTFCLFFLIVHILFYGKTQKNHVTERNKRLNKWSLFVGWGNQLLISADRIIENNLSQILCVVLEFWSNGEGLDCFSQHLLPKLSKVFVTCPQSVRKQIGTVLTCPNSAKWISALNCSKSAKWPIWNLYISSHLEARNIKFGQQVNIERVPLGTPPQAVVMSLAHNHMTNLFISSYRGATVIKFGQ